VIYKFNGPYEVVYTVFPGGFSGVAKPGDVREFPDGPPGPEWVPVEPEVKDEPEPPARTRKGQAQVDA
jgi:hypothetical protein